MTALHADTVDSLSTCSSEPSIPYEGIHDFNFKPEQYPNLEIKYKTREHVQLLNIKVGYVFFLKKKSLTSY
jgi:hypothetical protein